MLEREREREGVWPGWGGKKFQSECAKSNHVRRSSSGSRESAAWQTGSVSTWAPFIMSRPPGNKVTTNPSACHHPPRGLSPLFASPRRAAKPPRSSFNLSLGGFPPLSPNRLRQFLLYTVFSPPFHPLLASIEFTELVRCFSPATGL